MSFGFVHYHVAKSELQRMMVLSKLPPRPPITDTITHFMIGTLSNAIQSLATFLFKQDQKSVIYDSIFIKNLPVTAPSLRLRHSD